MFSTEFISLGVAALGIVGVTLTAVLSGTFQRKTVRAQIIKDLHVLEINARLAQEKLVREKFEKFFAEISALNANPITEQDTGSRNLAFSKCRTAAYALLAHAGPELAQSAVNMVEVLNKAYRSAGIADFEILSMEVSMATSKVTVAFVREIVEHRKAQDLAFIGALGGA